MITIKNIYKRIDKLEQFIQDKKDYTIIVAVENIKENNYYIQYYNKGVRTDFIYDKVENFFKDKHINIKDKKTFIKIFKLYDSK